MESARCRRVALFPYPLARDSGEEYRTGRMKKTANAKPVRVVAQVAKKKKPTVLEPEVSVPKSRVEGIIRERMGR